MSVLQGVKEFIATAKLAEERGLLISAADNYFKALIHAIDYWLSGRIGKIPDSHTERFQILKRENTELYEVVDDLFMLYVKSYRDVIAAEELERIKNGLKTTLKITGLEKDFKENMQ